MNEQAYLRGKVFAIGLHKTGTTSLATHLESLGYRTVHYPRVVDGVAYETLVAPLVGDKEAVLSVLDPLLRAYDGFTDVPFPGLYRPLAARYPDAKFILATRSLDDWWQSLSKHWLLHKASRTLNPFERVQYEDYLPGLRQASEQDAALFKDAHIRHLAACRVFLPADRLLEIDLDSPTKSDAIARFLCEEQVSFPHLNQSRRRRGWFPWRPWRTLGI